LTLCEKNELLIVSCK